MEVQKKANCIIGKDYPAPIVDHKEIHKVNIGRLKEAYSKQEAVKSPAKKQKQAPTSPAKSPAKKRKV